MDIIFEIPARGTYHIYIGHRGSIIFTFKRKTGSHKALYIFPRLFYTALYKYDDDDDDADFCCWPPITLDTVPAPMRKFRTNSVKERSQVK